MGCGSSSDAAPAGDQVSRGGLDFAPKKKSGDFNAIWAELRVKLPRSKSAEDAEKRKTLFNQFDPNGNGYLSLAEIDKGAREILTLDRLTDDLAPILMRAYTKARNVGTKMGNKRDNVDYVERSEFRLLMCYIYDFFELWIAFDEIDTSDDRRITLAEFKKAIPLVEKWGVKITDADATFKEIDANGGGFILFIEFCEWAFEKHLDADGLENIE